MDREETPVLLSIDCGISGYKFGVQIGKYAYESIPVNRGVPFGSTKWVVLRLKKRLPSGIAGNYKGQKCTFKIKLKNISNISEKQNPELYWSVESWEIAMSVGKPKGKNSFVIFRDYESRK